MAPRTAGFVAGAAQSAADLVEGAKAGLMSTALHGGDLIRRATGMERIIDRPENVDAMTPPESFTGKLGYYAEQGAEYLAPSARALNVASKIAPMTRVGSAVVKNPSLMRRAAAAGTVMGADAGWAGVQTGGDPTAMAIGAVAPPVIGGALRVGGALARTGKAMASGAAEGGVGGAVAGALRRVAPDDPTRMIVQAVKPRNSQVNFESVTETVAPRIKQVAQDMGLTLDSLDDVLTATKTAKRTVRAQFDEVAGPMRQMGVDLSPVADQQIASIPRSLKIENPAAYRRAVERANSWRRVATVEEAEQFLREANAQLEGQFAKFPMSQHKRLLADPRIAGVSAKAQALRDTIYRALDNPALPDSARTLNRQYGQLMEFEDSLLRRSNVAKRQQPESLSEQIGAVRAMSDMARGAWKLVHGDVFGMADIAAGRAGNAAAKYLKEQQTTDALLRRAFARVEPAAPFAPVPARPVAGLLERGAIPMGAVADDSYVRGVPAEPARREVAGYLPASTTASRQFEMPPSSEADAMVQGVDADRVVQRDPRTGQMQRVYTGEEAGAARQRAGSPYTPVLSVMPNAAAQAIPDNPDSDWDNYARTGLNVAGVAAMGAAFGPKVKAQLESLFPHLDAYNKPRSFMKPAKILETVEQSDLPAEVVARAREWVATLKGKPVKPKEIVAQILGEKFDRGRVLRRVSDAMTDGKKLAGAPLGVTTRRQEKSIVDRYIKMVEDGVHGADWYVDSGRSNLWHAGGNPALADKFGGALAVTSSSTGVPVNTGFGVKGHNQAIAGMTINTGRFPQNMRKPIEEIYNGAADDIGMKRDPFQQQMAIGGGYATKGDTARAVHDIWQGEAFGYVNPDGTPLRRGFTEAEHRWMDERTKEIIDTLNARKVGGKTDWNEGSVQAAAWTAAKIKAGQIKPEDAAKSFADYMDRYYLQTGRETVPGQTTKHLLGLADAPMPVRQEYDDAVGKILYDEQGRDRLAMGKGMLAGGQTKGPGVWRDDNGVLHVNPGRQVNQVAGIVEVKTPDGKMRQIEPASEALVRANEAEYAMLLGQDAFGGTMNDTTAKAAARDLADFATGAPMDEATLNQLFTRAPKLLEAVNSGNAMLMATPDGVRVGSLGAQNYKDVLQEVSAALGVKPELGRNMAGDFYTTNNWSKPEGAAGQAYARLIARDDLPKLVENFNKTAPDIARQLNTLDRWFAQKHNLSLDTAVMELREAIATKGFDGVREMATRYGVPLAMLLTLANATGLTARPEGQP
jgi:hypothetical protein